MPAEPTAMAYRILTRDEHYQSAGPKRILALDGGGLRGMLSLGILRQLETVLRERHGGVASFRLGHYFDLIAGTSTGAIIAAALAKGLSVDEVIGHYQRLGRQVFSKSWLRDGVVRARYDEQTLSDHLRRSSAPTPPSAIRRCRPGSSSSPSASTPAARGRSATTRAASTTRQRPAARASPTPTFRCGRWCAPPRRRRRSSIRSG